MMSRKLGQMTQVAGSVFALVAFAAIAGCASSVEGTGTAAPDGEITDAGNGPDSDGDSAAPVGGEKCLLVLHGTGGEGGESYVEEGVTKIFPAGNESGGPSWGGRRWLYFPDSRYEEALGIATSAVEGCGQIIIGGFSNGAAFTTAMYCRGETFDGRLTGVVIDDPVPDHGADNCEPGSNIDVTVYWTGALVEAEPGWKCAEAEWTCQGGETIGIDAYTENIGVEAKQSPNSSHEWYYQAPELTAFR